MTELMIQLSLYKRWVAGAAAALLLGYLVSGGCSGKGTLEGQITNKEGKPVTFGTVTVVASDNTVHSAPIRHDGSYEVKGIPSGPVRIAVSSPNPAPPPVPQPAAPGAKPNAPAANNARPGPNRTATGPAGVAAGPGGSKGGTKAGSGTPGQPDERQAFGLDPKGTIPPPAVAAPQNPPPPGTWYPIPGKYSNPQTSGLTTEAARGRKSHNITVE